MAKQQAKIVSARNLNSFVIEAENKDYIAINVPQTLTWLLVKEFGITNANQLLGRKLEVDIDFRFICAQKKEEEGKEIFCTMMEVL